MENPRVADEHIVAAAAKGEYTDDELKDAIRTLNDALQSRLPHHYKHSKLRTGEDYWILETNQGVVLALGWTKLKDELREAGAELSDERLNGAVLAHMNAFESWGYTISMSRQIAQRRKNPFFFPVFVEYPEHWRDAKYNARQEFEQYVWRFDLSPAEALDYWMVEENNLSTDEWAGRRGVGLEAIRKNIRAAKSKFDDEEGGATHDANMLRAELVENAPEDMVYDEETDRYYQPTEENADEIQAALDEEGED